MQRYTIDNSLFECRMKDCQMEDYLRSFYIDTDIYSICDDCPFMDAINKLAYFEDKAEALEGDVRFDHG